MASATQMTAPARGRTFHHGTAVLIFVAAGVAIRLWFAHSFFLNPDEALHYLLSLQPDLRATYQATLPTSHPPLYIVFLHYWGFLGRTEFFLRLPSVVASIAFCWFVYRWMSLVASDSAALICLALLLFSPSLIYLSTELRQYAFALCFSAAALYLLELAIQKASSRTMALSGICLWLALLTHYSAVLVALMLGLYGLWRIWGTKPPAHLLAAWIGTQAVGAAVAFVLFETQVLQLKTRGRFVMAAETYLRRSSFQPGQEHVASFIARATIRLFQYFFSQGAVGVAALLLYIAAIVILARRERDARISQPTRRQLLLLTILPLVVNCALGLKDLYPFGGTRHNSYLAIFIFPALALALNQWKVKVPWLKASVIGLVLLLCNLFPSPTGEYIRHRDQNRKEILSAVRFLRERAGQAKPIVTDNQGGLLLSYYLCGSKVVPFSGLNQHFSEAPCGDLKVYSLDPRQWIFRAGTFANDLIALKNASGLPGGQRVLIFQSGWLVDNEGDFRAELKQFGCPATHDFGRNILACDIALP